MAKDKSPNRTLSIALDLSCDYQGCGAHGTTSQTRTDGTIKRRCLSHLTAQTNRAVDAYLLKFLNLA